MLYDVSAHFGATIEMQQVMANAAALTINSYVLDSDDEYFTTLPTDENEHMHCQGDIIIVCYKSADRYAFKKKNFCFPLRLLNIINSLKKALNIIMCYSHRYLYSPHLHTLHPPFELIYETRGLLSFSVVLL